MDKLTIDYLEIYTCNKGYNFPSLFLFYGTDFKAGEGIAIALQLVAEFLFYGIKYEVE